MNSKGMLFLPYLVKTPLLVQGLTPANIARNIEKAFKTNKPYDEDDFLSEKSLEAVRKLAPQHAGIVELSQRLATARAEIRVQQAKAKVLLEQASLLDTGQYSPQAIVLLDEAKRFDPTNRIQVQVACPDFNTMCPGCRMGRDELTFSINTDRTEVLTGR